MYKYKFYLARYAHLDPFVFPLIVSSYFIAMNIYIFLCLPKQWNEDFIHFRKPWYLITLITLLALILTTPYIRIGINPTRTRLSRYIKLRLFFQTVILVEAALCGDEILHPYFKEFAWISAFGLLCFIPMCLGVQFLLEKSEMLNYKHMKEFEMDKIYKGKWSMMGAPLIFYLYCQVICGVRHLMHPITQLTNAASFSPSDSLILHFLATPASVILTLNGLILVTAIQKKSMGLLIIYYHIKTWMTIILRFSYSIIPFCNVAFFSDIIMEIQPHDDPEPFYTIQFHIHFQIQTFLEFFELAQVLRFQTFICLESELLVGQHSFKLNCGKKSPCDLFKAFKNVDKDVKGFIKSILIGSWRVSSEACMLGEGHFSKVYKGFIISLPFLTKLPVAIKVLNNVGPDTFESTLSELKTLSLVSSEHPALVRFLGICKLTNSPFGGELGIISEFLEAGCLLNTLKNMKKPEMSTLSAWSQEIANGMDFLSMKKVVHADLAARNILLTFEGHCKISDFGMSFRLHQYQTYARSTQSVMFPFRWMSPESLSYLTFSSESDVWSYGVLVWEIFSLGLLPWVGVEWTAEFVSDLQNNLRLPKPILASEKIYFGIMKHCWRQNPKERKTFREIKLFWEISNTIECDV